jgi:hypothetical protein
VVAKDGKGRAMAGGGGQEEKVMGSSPTLFRPLERYTHFFLVVVVVVVVVVVHVCHLL